MSQQVDQGHAVVVVYGVCASLATLTLILRLIARRIKKIPLWLDDWIIAAALIFTWVIFALGLRGVTYGLGQHADALPDDFGPQFAQDFYLLQIFYTVAVMCVKLSFLCLYKRMFIGRVFINIVYANIGVVSVFFIGAIFACIFACFPIYLVWQQGDGYCIASDTFTIAFGIVNFAAALSVWILPIPMVWRLQLSRAPRIAIMVVFLLGLTSCAAALARAVISSFALESTDHTWDYQGVFVWSMVEPAVGIICASLPCARITLCALLPQSWLGPFATRASYVPRRSSLRNSQIKVGWDAISTRTVSTSLPKELDLESSRELPLNEKPSSSELPLPTPRYELATTGADGAHELQAKS